MFATSEARVLSCEEQIRDSVQGENYIAENITLSNSAIFYQDFETYLIQFGFLIESTQLEQQIIASGGMIPAVELGF